MFKKLLVLLVFPLILGVVVTIGAALLRSVVRNEQPITTLRDIYTNPACAGLRSWAANDNSVGA